MQEECQDCDFWERMKKSKLQLIFVILWYLLNFGLLIHGNTIPELFNFPTFLLNIFIGNYGLYFTYYGIMKMIKGEHFNWIVLVLITLVFAFNIPAMMYFSDKAKMPDYSPALSRNYNMPCEFSIFDKHDLWHFLSAAGLFSNFLLLLVIDDGIYDHPQKEIPIF